MSKVKSNKEIYAENRTRYYSEVISLYSHGMTIRGIAEKVPISKSTIQRWVNKYAKTECNDIIGDIVIPRTPTSVAKTIRAMQKRISELESRLKENEVNHETLLPNNLASSVNSLQISKMLENMKKELCASIDAIIQELN